MFAFVAGAVVGAVVVNLYNKNEKMRTKVDQGGECLKKYAFEGYEKSVELVNEAKKKYSEYKEKKDSKKEHETKEKEIKSEKDE